MSAHKYKVVVFAKLPDEATEVERVKVFATDPDDACGEAIDTLRDKYGCEVDCAVQRIARLSSGNADELAVAA